MTINGSVYWTAFLVYQFADWLVNFVDNLCRPVAISKDFPTLSETRIDDRFIAHCQKRLLVIARVREGDIVDDHISSAAKRVLEVLTSCRGKRVIAVREPALALWGDFVPVLLELTSLHERAVVQNSGRPLSDWHREIRRIGRVGLDEARKTVSQVTALLTNLGGVPPEGSGAHAATPTPAELESEEELILRLLASSDARRLPKQLEKEATRIGERICAKSIGKVLRRLNDRGLVDYPPGKRRGAAITERGRTLAH